jgi:hypothetical protein
MHSGETQSLCEALIGCIQVCEGRHELARAILQSVYTERLRHNNSDCLHKQRKARLNPYNIISLVFMARD